MIINKRAQVVKALSNLLTYDKRCLTIKNVADGIHCIEHRQIPNLRILCYSRPYEVHKIYKIRVVPDERYGQYDELTIFIGVKDKPLVTLLLNFYEEKELIWSLKRVRKFIYQYLQKVV